MAGGRTQADGGAEQPQSGSTHLTVSPRDRPALDKNLSPDLERNSRSSPHYKNVNLYEPFEVRPNALIDSFGQGENGICGTKTLGSQTGKQQRTELLHAPGSASSVKEREKDTAPGPSAYYINSK